MAADVSVALSRPSHRRTLRILQIDILQPRLPLARPLPALDLRRQLPRPPPRNLKRLPPPPAVHQHLRDGAVPHAMQIHL